MIFTVIILENVLFHTESIYACGVVGWRERDDAFVALVTEAAPLLPLPLQARRYYQK